MNDEIKALSDEWDNHKKLPFPNAPGEGSPFSDLFPQLVEFDGFVAGMVCSTLNGKPMDKNDVGRALLMVNDFFLGLNAVQPKDAATDKYRSSINERVESVHRLIEDVLLVTYSQ